MKILDRLFARASPGTVRYQMVTERGNGFYAWNGKLYQSDIVRACMRPKVKGVGKLVGKHLRETIDREGKRRIAYNADARLRYLLEEPNPYMTGQKLQEKLAAQLVLNNNAFALIIRDENGLPVEIYPITASSVQAIYRKDGTLCLDFILVNGRRMVFAYTDIIHLRADFYENDLFGSPLAQTLMPLMEIVGTTDQGIVKAIRNSSVVRWLIKYNTAMRDDALTEKAKEFAQRFLDVENGSGVVVVDSKSEATQISPNDYVPNAAQMDRTTQRIYAIFNTNPKIVLSQYNEDEWNAYYEAELEPIVRELGEEYTRKLFSRRERAAGNRIVFEATNLATASMSTKLGLQAMVDRGAMLPNEWRAVLNLAPIDGGDVPIRRLDTAPTTQTQEGGSETA
ncbi:MAG: phage portal protein [Butyricicoccus pullicaecorum]|nr:phage portal protein [Butyricicoccus pullicaecorum]